MCRLLRWRVIVATFVLLVVGGAATAYLYARSDAAARLVQTKLEGRLGTTAKFDRLNLGLTGTTISSLQIYENGISPNAEPFIVVAETHLNISALDAAMGSDPTTITLRDARVLLRFDRNGDLLTRLPTASGGDALPKLRIESGNLTIRQEGRADSVFNGIDVTLVSQSDAIEIKGMVEDQSWGKWTADGLFPTGDRNGNGHLVLQTKSPQHVTPALLKHVPFVNPNAWTQVGLEGMTPARLDITIDRKTDHVSYRMTLDPTQTTVDVPSIGLHFVDATGGLVAEGSVVTLTNVCGKSADGEVRLDARMDFGGDESAFRFMADLTRMDVHQLPKTWRLPDRLDGRMSGKVEFSVVLPDSGGARVEATGKATIADAKLGGRPVPPIELDVGTGPGGGLDFAEQLVVSVRHEVLKPMDPLVVGPPAPMERTKRTGLVSSVLQLAAKLVKPAGAPIEEKAYLHFNVAFRDVDLAELLKSAGLDVPVAVVGKVTVQVQIDIPTESPDDLKAYRLKGTIVAKRVMVDELAIEGVAAKLDMRDGKLTVKDFVGRLPALAGNGPSGGAFEARGEMGVGNDYPFKATVKLDKVALEYIDQLKSLLPLSLRLSGEASAHADLEGTLNPMAIQSNGEAHVVKLRAGSIPVDNLTFRWESDGQSIRFRDASARLFGGEVTGDFDVPFREDVPGTGALKLQNLDLGELSKSLLAGANLKLEGKAAGTVKLRSPAAGEGESRGAIADVDLQAPSMKLQNIPARKIKGTAKYASGVLNYSLMGEALGGQFEVDGQFPPLPKKGTAKPGDKKEVPKKDTGLDLGRLKLRNMQLSRLWELVGLKNAMGALDADVSGDFPLTTDDDGRLIGTGKLRAERFRWAGREFASAGQSVLRLTSTEMRFEELTLFMGSGVARVHMTINRKDIDRSEASVILTNVPASRLFFLVPELADRFDLNVDGRLTTSIGRDWRGSGVLTANRGKVFGVPVTDVRIPVDWVVVPSRDYSVVRVRDLSATAAGGSVTGKTDARFSADQPPKFSGDLVFRNVNLGQAYRDAGRYVGNMPISGKFDFGADQFRGTNDLTAKLEAKLGESQPFGLPVFAALLPYTGIGQSSQQTVREGDVKAVLAGGVWRLDRLTLTGPSLDLYADGTVTTGGRLNLGVAATSRQGPGQAVIRRLIPLPVLSLSSPTESLSKAVLADALALLGNYVVYLDVTGTVDSPQVRVQTLRTLTEDAIRFFLLRFALKR